VKTRDKKKVKNARFFEKKTIYSLLQVHFPGNLILDSESSVNFTSEMGWPPFGHESIGHESIGHEPFTALKQWKASRHRSLWLVVSNRDVVNRDTPSEMPAAHDACFPAGLLALLNY